MFPQKRANTINVLKIVSVKMKLGLNCWWVKEPRSTKSNALRHERKKASLLVFALNMFLFFYYFFFFTHTQKLKSGRCCWLFFSMDAHLAKAGVAFFTILVRNPVILMKFIVERGGVNFTLYDTGRKQKRPEKLFHKNKITNVWLVEGFTFCWPESPCVHITSITGCREML